MERPLLSICIPTYNRAYYLENCLESIKIQLDRNVSLSTSVEVVISDNCSTDNTANVAEKYRKHFANFKYSINTSNVGFDLNVLNVVKEATGMYCWYLGDDDIIVNGGIEFIIDRIKDGKYDFVGVESKPTAKNNDNKAKTVFSNDSLVEISDFNDFYFKGYCQGGFSVLIFNKEMWMSSINTAEYLKHWLYYETVLKVLVATKKKMLYVKDPVIITGQDCRWAEHGTELFTFINSNILLERMVDFGFEKKRLTDLLVQNSKKIIIILLRAKGHGLECNMANLKYTYSNLKTLGHVRLFFVTIVYFVPNWIVVMVRDLKKKLKTNS